MFCLILTNLTFTSFGCHGNQGVNPGDMAVFKFIEGIWLNFVLVSTKSIWTLVIIIAKHIYKILC